MNKKYKQIVENVLKAFDEGTIPWRSGIDYSKMACPVNYITNKPYRGFNQLMLLMNDCEDNRYITFLQAKSKGFSVKKGTVGTPILFFSFVEKKNKDSDEKTVVPLVKNSTVFNCKDIDGVEERTEIDKTIKPQSSDIIQKIVADLKVDLRIDETTNYAHYAESFLGNVTYIQMPPQYAYEDQNVYNATLGHELIHWTSNERRLNRILPVAFEELVAELGTLFLFSRLKLNSPFPKHASYLKSWTKLMKDKPGSLMKAANLATDAVEYLINQSTVFQEALKG